MGDCFAAPASNRHAAPTRTRPTTDITELKRIDVVPRAPLVSGTEYTVVVRGVIDMARSLGLAVIAEGVETEEQLGLLAREGCNYYQGFLCAEPLREQQLGQLLEDWKG